MCDMLGIFKISVRADKILSFTALNEHEENGKVKEVSSGEGEQMNLFSKKKILFDLTLRSFDIA